MIRAVSGGGREAWEDGLTADGAANNGDTSLDDPASGGGGKGENVNVREIEAKADH